MTRWNNPTAEMETTWRSLEIQRHLYDAGIVHVELFVVLLDTMNKTKLQK